MERRRDGKIAESNYLYVSSSLRLSVSPSLCLPVSFLIVCAPLVIALTLAPAQSQEKILSVNFSALRNLGADLCLRPGSANAPLRGKYTGLPLRSAPEFLQEEKIPNPVVWSLKAGLAPDGAMTAELTAKIEDGWHLYSLTPIANGPKPTRITLPTEQAFELAGEIEAPDPIVGNDPNFGAEVEYYEESVTFKLPLKRRAGWSGYRLMVEARYQVCTSQLCLPPKTVKLEADVK
jgi:Disulphide bond corrector protein DsbC